MKKIVYLDQNYIAKLAEPVNYGGSVEDNARLKRLSDLMIQRTQQNKVICPQSIFHEIEAQLPRERDVRQELVERLSVGLHFRRYDEILREQVYLALKQFLGLRDSGDSDVAGVFSEDPHESIENRMILLGKGKAISYARWGPTPSGATQEPRNLHRYITERIANQARGLTKQDLPQRVKAEKEGVLEFLYGKPTTEDLYPTWQDPRVEEFLNQTERADQRIPDLNALLRIPNVEFNTLKDTFEELTSCIDGRLLKFLKSDELSSVPFIDIFSTLEAGWSCFRDNVRNTPEEGDAIDAGILATVLPYCDVVATSTDMKTLHQLTGLFSRYPADVFSGKMNEIDRLIRWMESL